MKLKKIISYILCMIMMCLSLPAQAEEGKTDKKGKYIDGIYVPYGTTLAIYGDKEIKETADKLFSMLVPNNPETADIQALYDKGKYLEALIVYRNMMIDRLRAIPDEADIGNNPWGWWNVGVEGSWKMKQYQFKVLCGQMTEEEFNTHPDVTSFTSRGYAEFRKDYGGFLEVIDPDQDSHIRWLEVPTWINANIPSDSGAITFSASGNFPLVMMFASTGDEIYVKKFIQITNDYACNFVDMVNQAVEGMSEEAGKNYQKFTDSRVWKWQLGGYNASAKLETAGVAERSTKAFVLLAKSLKNPERENQYTGDGATETIKSIYTNPLPEESYDLIDPVRWGNICYHYAKNEFFRLSSYLDGGAIGNQQTNGMTGLMKYLCLFRDFSCVLESKDTVINMYNETMNKLNQPDGGYLEISAGYNGDDFAKKKEAAEWFVGAWTEMEGVVDLVKSNTYFARLTEQYTSPVNLMSNYGNGYNGGTVEYWNDEKKAADLDESRKDLQDNKYTSVYLPYSGYGSMREDWTSDSHYLSFFNYNRRNDGHEMTGTGSINQLTAYKRTLLLSGGTHDYEGVEKVAESAYELKPMFYELNSFLDEKSTKKWSTVIVNNKSQANKEFIYNSDGTFSTKNQWGTALKEVSNEILDSRWVSNDSYDFAESKWEQGYSPIDALTDEINKIKYESYKDTGAYSKDAVHNRQITYVKDAGIWVVLDEVENTLASSKENVYDQIWNFPTPYTGDDATPGVNTGFTDEQIVTDDENNIVYTNDKGDPNIFISSYSQNDISYKKYYGHYEQGEMGIGWSRGSGRNSMGRFGPRGVVYVEWKDKGYGNKTQLATVLAPSPDENNPIIESKDLSDKSKNITGFELTTKDGCKVTYYASPEVQQYTVGNFEAEAKSILVTETKDGKVSGIVMDCEFAANKKIILTIPAESFTFTLDEKANVKETDMVLVPEIFEWVDYPDGTYKPAYTKSEQEAFEKEVAEAVPYNDIEGHWAKDTIVSLYRSGTLESTDDFKFRPDESVTRADFVTMIMKALGKEEAEYKDIYSDISASDENAGYIQVATDMGIIEGFDGKFDPTGLLTREQMAKILVLATNSVADTKDTTFADWNEISDWAKEYVGTGRKNGLFKGNAENKFMPKSNLTRAEAAQCAFNIGETR